jgi:hypothetical protein
MESWSLARTIRVEPGLAWEEVGILEVETETGSIFAGLEFR